MKELMKRTLELVFEENPNIKEFYFQIKKELQR